MRAKQRNWIVQVAIIATMVQIPNIAKAASFYFDAYSGYWTNNLDWTADSGLPGSSDDVFFGSSIGGSPVTCELDTGSTTINEMRVGDGTSHRGTLNITGGDMLVDALCYNGYYGTGIIGLFGGSLDFTSNLYLGYNASGTGTVNVTDGALSVTGICYLGHVGKGIFNQSDGTVNFDSYLYLGNSTDASGKINITGGSMSVANRAYIGQTKTGVINLSGGSLNLTSILYLGNGGAGDGAINITDGNLTVADYSYVGYAAGASGIFNISGGVFTNNQWFMLGTSGNGVINLSGTGKIYRTAGSLYMAYSAGSTGIINQTGGLLDNGNQALRVADSGSAIYNISGGILTNVNLLSCPNGVGSGMFDIVGSSASIHAAELVVNNNGILKFTPDYNGVTPFNISGHTTLNTGAEIKVDFTNSPLLKKTMPLINWNGTRFGTTPALEVLTEQWEAELEIDDVNNVLNLVITSIPSQGTILIIE